MPLSEDEQRILREIEEQLHRDPNFARDLSPVRGASRRSLIDGGRRWCPRRRCVCPAPRHQSVPGLRGIPRGAGCCDGGRTAPPGRGRRGDAAGVHHAAQRRQRSSRQRPLTSAAGPWHRHLAIDAARQRSPCRRGRTPTNRRRTSRGSRRAQIRRYHGISSRAVWSRWLRSTAARSAAGSPTPFGE